MKVKPCPTCHKNSKLAIISGFEKDSLAIECENCGFYMGLETKLPINPQEIIDEWNRRVTE
ncbi:MAG: hypothetical protein IJT54_04030 [Candidatus Methanomethylophilaceae archaeon]|nr:hypothetical protein [Candidatus Methanomethylophilaceae archaeon]